MTDPDQGGLTRFSKQIEVAHRRAFYARVVGQLIQVGTVLGLLAVWELAVVMLHLNPIILPRVSVIASSLWSLSVDGTIPWHGMLTMRRVFAGFAAAALLGVAVGMGMNRFQSIRNMFDPIIAALYPLPKIALVPLLLIWFGSGDLYKFVIVLATAFFPIVISAYQGLRQVDPGLVAAARDLGANEWRIQWDVMLPAATPSILAGMRIGMGVAIILTVAAEMIASQNGLGYLLVAAGSVLETEKVFAVIFAVAILGLLVNKAHDWIDASVAGWAFDGQSR